MEHKYNYQHFRLVSNVMCLVFSPVLKQPVLSQSIVYISSSIANEQQRMVEFGAGAA